jgi:hypothetical protein
MVGKRKEKESKYVSLVPKPPKGLTPYQIFTKEKLAEFAAANDTSPASESHAKLISFSL